MSASPLRSEDIWRGKQQLIQELLTVISIIVNHLVVSVTRPLPKTPHPAIIAVRSRSLGPYCLTLNNNTMLVCCNSGIPSGYRVTRTTYVTNTTLTVCYRIPAAAAAAVRIERHSVRV